MAGRKRRGFSFGTVFMLIFTAVVLGSTMFILLRLSDGHQVDLSRLNAPVVRMEDTSAEKP